MSPAVTYLAILLLAACAHLSCSKLQKLERRPYHPIPFAGVRPFGSGARSGSNLNLRPVSRPVLQKTPTYFGPAPQYEPSEIIGGSPAQSDLKKKVVLVTIKQVAKTVKCTGTVLLDYLVLTAAHCFTNLDGRFEVLSVTVTTGPVLRRGTVYSVAYVDVLKDYNGYGQGNDVALVWIIKRFKFVEEFSFPDSYPSAGAKVFAAGYGETETGKLSGRLLEVEQKYQRLEDCRVKWPSPVRPLIRAGQVICATDPSFPTSVSTGACNGDSGGPLVSRESGSIILYGISSWGAPDCVGPDATSFFADMVTYFPLIQSFVFQDYTAWMEVYNAITP